MYDEVSVLMLIMDSCLSTFSSPLICMAPLICDLPSYRGLEFVLMFVLVQWDLLVVVASTMHSFLCRIYLSLSKLAVGTTLHPAIMGKKGWILQSFPGVKYWVQETLI